MLSGYQVEPTPISIIDLERIKLILAISSGLSSTRKQELLLMLFIAYRDGIKKPSGEYEIYPDEQKSLEYLIKALDIPPPTTVLSPLADCLGIEAPTSYISMWIPLLARITSARLGFVRTFRLHPVAFFAVSTSTGLLFKTLQLSYFLEIAFCVGMVLEKSLRPQTDPNEWWFQRLESGRAMQAIWNRDFINMLSNAVVWGGVNAECFSADTPPIKTWLMNALAFLFDVPHDFAFAYWDGCDYQKLRLDLTNNILSDKNPFSDEELALLQTNCDKKISIYTFKWKRLTAVALGILAGMCFFYLASFLALPGTIASLMIAHPYWAIYLAKMTPDAITLLKHIGSEFVIIMGVFFGGIGGRLFWSDMTSDVVKHPFNWIYENWYTDDLFDNNKFKKSAKNFAKTVFVSGVIPVGIIMGLMSFALIPNFSIPVFLIALSISAVALSYALEYKNNFYTPKTPDPDIEKPSSVEQLIDKSSLNGFIPHTELPNIIKKTDFAELQKYTCVDEKSLLTALGDLTKKKEDRSIRSNVIIDKILRVNSTVKSNSNSAPDLTIPLLAAGTTPDEKLTIKIPESGSVLKLKLQRTSSNSSTPAVTPRAKTGLSWCNMFKWCCSNNDAIEQYHEPLEKVGSGKDTPHNWH